MIERVITDVCSSRRPVNSFKGVSSTVVVYEGETLSGPQGDFSLQYRKWPLGCKAARLSGGAISSSYYTSTGSTHFERFKWSFEELQLLALQH